MGVAKTSWKRSQLFSVLASHCHSADGIFNTKFISCYLTKSLCRYNLVLKIASEIEFMYRLYHHLCSATPLDLAAITKFKSAKVNSEGLLCLSTKISFLVSPLLLHSSLQFNSTIDRPKEADREACPCGFGSPHSSFQSEITLLQL